MRKLLALTLSLLLLVAAIPTGALTLETASPVAEEAITAGEAALSAPAAVEESQYGELILSYDFEDGTTNAASHADWVNTTLGTSGAAISVVDDPTGGDNKVLLFNRTTQWGFIRMPFDDVANRLNRTGTYILTYDVLYPQEYGVYEEEEKVDGEKVMVTKYVTPQPTNTFYGNSGNDPHNNLSYGYTNAEKGTWKHITRNTRNEVLTVEQCEEAGIIYNEEKTNAIDSTILNANGDKIYQYPMAWINRSYIYDFGNPFRPDTTYQWYVDNIKLWFTPTPVVTFEIQGDTDEDTESMRAAFGATRRAMTPGTLLPELAVPDGYQFLGWMDFGGNMFTTVPEEDVTLYAYIETVDGIVLSADNYLLRAGKSEVATVTKSGDPVDRWEIDLGNSDAVVSQGDTSVIVTSGAKAGLVKVTAYNAAGRASNTVEIQVHSSTVTVPGLNMLTGTTDPADFTHGLFGFSSTFGDRIVVDPEDETNRVLYRISSANPNYNGYMSWSMQVPQVEGRKYYVASKLRGKSTDTTLTNWDTMWIISMTGNPQPGFYGTFGGWGGFRREVVAPNSNTKFEFNIRMFKADYSLHTVEHWIDDFEIVPFYKVTYVDSDGGILRVDDVLFDTSYADYIEHGFLTELVPNYKPGATYTIDGVAYDADHPYPLAYEDVTVVTAYNENQLYFIDTDGTVVNADSIMEMPLPSLLGLDDTNFVGWLDEDGVLHKPGELVDYTQYLGKSLTAFRQDASMPAMGFAYEMNDQYNYADPTVYPGAPGKVTVTYENGIAVCKSVKTSGRDPRYVAQAGGLDPSEYYIFQFREMPVKSVDPSYTVYFFVKGENPGYSCTADGIHMEAKAGMNLNEWNTVEVNMATQKNWAKHAWGPNMVAPWQLGAIWLDIGQDTLDNAENGTFEYHLDYIRMYRGGYNTVSYYDGDTLLFTDENRGLGTGYLLNGNYPEKEGYTFLGWSLEENGAIVNAIDLTADTSVYAVWAEGEVEAPYTYTSFAEIRSAADSFNGKDALRFKASVTLDQKAYADEYGFLVTREALLPKGAAFTFDTTANYLRAVAYNAADGTDIIYANEDEDVIFTVACYNIPEDKHDDKVVVRSYLKGTNGGNSFTLYGAPAVKSFNDGLAG